jgi:hypothetical protein
MLLVTVSSSAETSEDFEAASKSRCPLLPWEPGLIFSIFRFLGQVCPQLTARRRLDTPFWDVESLDGRGDDDTMSCARAGFAAPSGVLWLAGLLRENRSHSSRVGSGCGDFKALVNLFILTAGTLLWSAHGEDVGEELLARFLPLRASMGERAAPYSASGLLSHRILSLGDTSFSSSAFALGSTRSFQLSLVTGVVRSGFSVSGSACGAGLSWPCALGDSSVCGS